MQSSRGSTHVKDMIDNVSLQDCLQLPDFLRCLTELTAQNILVLVGHFGGAVD